MMFSKRSPFKQVPTGANKNTNPILPPQKVQPIQEQKGKSLEKDVPKLKNSFSFNPTPQSVKSIIGMDSMVERFFFLVSDPWNPQGLVPTPQASLLWKYSLQKAFPGQKKLLLAFKQQQYVISNYSGDGYPHVIWICVDGFSGYLDSNGVQSTRVAALVLSEVNPVLDSTESKVVDLLYSLKSPVAWDVPPSITQLKFRVLSDDDIIFAELPLPNQIALNFEIRHL